MNTVKQETLALMKELTQVYGVSGQEEQVREHLKPYYEELADEVIYDNLGSIFAVKKSKQPNAFKVMIAGHMDEVGFVVKKITANGLLEIAPIGGLWEQTLLSSRVTLINRDRKEFKGAIGSIPPHLLDEATRAKPMKIDNMLVDLGFTSEEEIKNANIRIGDMVVVDGSFEVLGNGQRLLSKAWDDRYGLIMGIELLREFQDADLPFDLIVGGTVQEEVGCRGAKTATYAVEPDLAIVLDCSPANDAKGYESPTGGLGKGLLIRFLDKSYLPNRTWLHDFEDLCAKHQIAHQYYQSAGGTDAGQIHSSFAGVPTLTACIPARYIHTNSSIIDVQDYLSAFDALKHILSELNHAKWEAYRTNNR